MKKYLLALPLAAVLGLTACEDYLDVAPSNTLTTDSFWGSPYQAEQGLNGIYHDLVPMAYHTYYLADIPSDETYGEWDTERTWSTLCVHDHNITALDELNGAWTDYYEAIAHANTFLEKVPDITGFTSDAIKNQMLGEAYFIRAYCYFDLVRFFGNIPLFDHTLSLNEALTLGQSAPTEVYKLIISDLEQAESLLNNAPTDFRGNAVAGKPTQIAAKAMLGRVYLTMATHPDVNGGDSYKQLAKGKFAEVLAYAGIGEGNTTGTPTRYWAADAKEWAGMFLHENDNKYFIWELQYATDAAKTLGNNAIFEMQPEVRCDSFYPVRIFGNKLYVAADILEMYGHDGTSSFGSEGNHNKDKRADWTVCYLNGNDLVNATSGTGYSGEPFYTKFLETTPKREAYGYEALTLGYNDYYKDEINFPIIRLEDVMLMYCEVAGYSAYTLHLLNLIRERATDAVTAAEAQADWAGVVKRERRLEFTQEGIRWHDMVRNGQIEEYKAMLQKYYTTDYAQTAIANISSKYYRYAIPQDQINIKDGLYEQNPEYK